MNSTSQVRTWSALPHSLHLKQSKQESQDLLRGITSICNYNKAQIITSELPSLLSIKLYFLPSVFHQINSFKSLNFYYMIQHDI